MLAGDRPQKVTLSGEYRSLLTYARLGSLCYINFYQLTGIQYRDIKAVLDLPDNVIGPQLLWLKTEEYVRSDTEKRDGEGVSIYYITQKGKTAYEAITAWLRSLPDFMLVESK